MDGAPDSEGEFWYHLKENGMWKAAVAILAAAMASLSPSYSLGPTQSTTTPAPDAIGGENARVDPKALMDLKVTTFDAVFRRMLSDPKGEYETTESYEKRISALAGGEYIFSVRPAELKYNADADGYEAAFQPDLVYLGGPIEINDQNSGAMIISARDKATGSYVGQTGMGARVRVAKDTEVQEALVYSSQKIMQFQTLFVPAPAALARALKAKLRFYVRCRLAPGLAGPARLVKARATPEYPSYNDRVLIFHYLYVDKITLIATDGQKGHMLASDTVVNVGNK